MGCGGSNQKPSKQGPPADVTNFYALEARNANGNTISMAAFRHTVILVSSVARDETLASSNFEGFGELVGMFPDILTILLFPCGESTTKDLVMTDADSDCGDTITVPDDKDGNKEALRRLSKNDGVMANSARFTVMAEVACNGKFASPIFNFLRHTDAFTRGQQGVRTSINSASIKTPIHLQRRVSLPIPGSFAKFLIGYDGQVHRYCAPHQSPTEMQEDIFELLAKKQMDEPGYNGGLPGEKEKPPSQPTSPGKPTKEDKKKPIQDLDKLGKCDDMGPLPGMIG